MQVGWVSVGSQYLGRVVGQAIRNGDMQRHIADLRGIYKRKLDRMEDGLRRYCGPYCTWKRPAAGFFLWLELPASLPTRDVQTAANEKGVIIGQGPQFFADGRATNHIRLAFSYVAMEEIEEGCHRLREAMAEVAARNAAK